MIVMPSNNSGMEASRLFRDYPGRLAHLQSADSLREPKFGINWSLDNGVFGAFSQGRVWDEAPLYRWLDKYADREPDWVVVPDWVGDAKKTINLWREHAPRVAAYSSPLALAVQDGMMPCDVRGLEIQPDVIFVGGSTTWKFRTLKTWTSNFEKVHVGRVSTERKLWQAHNAGAYSADSTGFFRAPDRTKSLRRYLEQSSRGFAPQLELELAI